MSERGPTEAVAPDAGATSTRAEARRLLALAWPVMLTSLNWTLLHLTDVVVVGLVGPAEVAALGASRALTYVGIVMAVGAMTGVLVFVARAHGARDAATTARLLREGLVLGALLGLAGGALLFAAATPALAALGVAPAVVPGAARVVRVMALAYPFQLVLIAASFFLEGVSRPRRVTAVNLATLPVNALLAWSLSGGHAGLPALGAVGAAAATVVASALGAVLMVAAALRLPDAASAGRRIDRRGIAALARFGLVPAIASGLELAGFSILIALSTQLGTATTHAFQIVFSVHNLTFALALGLGSAAGVRTGNAVGEGRPRDAGRRTAIAAMMAAGSTAMCAAVLCLAPGLATQAFPASAEAHRLAAAMLAIWAPFILFDGLQVVFAYALRSLGDQVAAGINGIVAFFAVTGGLGWWLVAQGVGPMALVWASGIGMVAAAALNGARLWRTVRRL